MSSEPFTPEMEYAKYPRAQLTFPDPAVAMVVFLPFMSTNDFKTATTNGPRKYSQ